MAEVNVQKSSFLKKKEEPNTDFSLVKGALTQNVDRLEKFVEAIPYKYIKRMRKSILFYILFMICLSAISFCLKMILYI